MRPEIIVMSHTSAGCWVDNYIQVVDTHGVEVWHVFMRLKNIEGWFMDTLIPEIGHWLKFVTVEVSFTVWSFFFLLLVYLLLLMVTLFWYHFYYFCLLNDIKIPKFNKRYKKYTKPRYTHRISHLFIWKQVSGTLAGQ